MYSYSELNMVLPPIIKCRGEVCYVVCHALRGDCRWLESKNYYLLQNGMWNLSTVSDEGVTGYFDSEHAARATLKAVVHNHVISARVGNIFFLNLGAESISVRKDTLGFRQWR